MLGSGVDTEFVVAATQVLDERVTTDHHRRSPVAFESTYGARPRSETAMRGVEQDLIDHPQQRRSNVGGDLGWPAMRTQDRVEDPLCRRGVSPARDVDVERVKNFV